ncbi:MAG: TetR/AcrR family transcriptional regulator, partial [Burkholderiales bacterium]
MDTTQNKNEPRFERRKDARPGEILDAALDLFVEKGFAATRLEDVAQRAGVSKGTVYLYFDSKEDLFKAVIRSGMVRAIEEAERRVAAYPGSAADLLREL